MGVRARVERQPRKQQGRWPFSEPAWLAGLCAQHKHNQQQTRKQSTQQGEQRHPQQQAAQAAALQKAHRKKMRSEATSCATPRRLSSSVKEITTITASNICQLRGAGGTAGEADGRDAVRWVAAGRERQVVPARLAAVPHCTAAVFFSCLLHTEPDQLPLLSPLLSF